MSKRQTRRGRLAAAISVLAWSALAVIIPVAVSVTTDAPPPGAVVAASSDQIGIITPLAIDLFGVPVSAERGTVSLLGRGEDPDSRTRLRQMLAAGTGRILAEGVALSFGASPLSQNTAFDEGFDPALLTSLSNGQYESLLLRRATMIIPVSAQRVERLTNVELEVSRVRKSMLQFKGTADVRGIPHTIEGTIGSTDKRQNGTPPVKVTIDGLLIKATLDGRMQPSGGPMFSGQLDLAVATDVPTLIGLRAIAGSLPKTAGPEFDVLKVKGGAVWSAEALALDAATVNFRGQEAQGAVHVAFGADRNRFSATLAAKSLDAVQLLKSDSSKSLALETVDRIAGQISNWLSSGTTDHAHSVDADLRISTGRITGLPLGAGSAAISIVMQGGKIDAEISELTYAGGRASSQIAIDLNRLRPVMVVRARVDGMDFAALTTATLGQPLLQGTGLVSMDVRSEGLTADALARSLDGHVNLSQTDGGRLGLDLRSLLAQSGRTATTGWPALKGSTSFDRLDGKVSIRGGSATIDSLTLIQGETSISLTGEIGLEASHLSVDVQVPQPAAGSTPADQNVGIIELRGSLSTPEATPRVRSRSGEPSSASGTWR